MDHWDVFEEIPLTREHSRFKFERATRTMKSLLAHPNAYVLPIAILTAHQRTYPKLVSMAAPELYRSFVERAPPISTRGPRFFRAMKFVLHAAQRVACSPREIRRIVEGVEKNFSLPRAHAMDAVFSVFRYLGALKRVDSEMHLVDTRLTRRRGRRRGPRTASGD